MDRSTPIYLVAESFTEDEYGVQTPTYSRRMVYANVSSVSQSEFFDGGRAGLNPELRITMFLYDYNGESILEVDGKTFDIYRTYMATTDTVELYAQRKQGVRNIPDIEPPADEV